MGKEPDDLDTPIPFRLTELGEMACTTGECAEPEQDWDRDTIETQPWIAVEEGPAPHALAQP
jgi:hypothetical protein